MGKDVIDITSRVNSRDGQPAVELRWGKEAGELTPEAARDHALAVLEAAEAAETDAFLIAFLTEKTGLHIHEALPILRDFRNARILRREKHR